MPRLHVPLRPLVAVRSVQFPPLEMELRKLRFTILVPLRVAAPPKFKRSDALLLRSTSNESLAVLSEMPELPSVIVGVAPSAKLSVEPTEALRPVLFEERAPSPLKRRVPPPVDCMLPVFVFVPASVVAEEDV